jgi:hypothetical protein
MSGLGKSGHSDTRWGSPPRAGRGGGAKSAWGDAPYPKPARSGGSGRSINEGGLAVERVANPAHQVIARVAHVLHRTHRAAGVERSFSEVGEVLRDFGVIDAADCQGGYGEKYKKFHGGLRCDGAPDYAGQASGAKSAMFN